MLIPSERDFWKASREVITAISQDSPLKVRIRHQDSWIYISGLEEPWFNLGYIHNQKTLRGFSGSLHDFSLYGVVYGHSKLPRTDVPGISLNW